MRERNIKYWVCGLLIEVKRGVRNIVKWKLTDDYVEGIPVGGDN